ncbi:vasoactive intestinal polypeptide receptor-like, partial [Physella acuta]|uniref:vasoactive intestinal polypeptide receptor-like n=1 Tax=Physella acuta TaxID=109671 RepID=UPI0027DCF0B1
PCVHVYSQKTAKSTLVLIPLFGVHFIVFAWLPNNVNPTAELVQLYFEMFFNSVQGFFVSVLFCFMNGEVQSEFRKKWQRFRITRFNHLPKSRNSSHNATFATYLSRPRESNASVTQLPDSRDNGNGIIRGRNSNLSCKDTTISLLPLKNAHNGHGKNTILEAEEQELINNQTSGYETDNHTRINDYT